MMYSVTDVQGINRISERVLANAAQRARRHDRAPAAASARDSKPALGLTMFGVTTPCVQAVAEAPGGRLRLPRVPRHRRRRPVDGEARRLGPARRRDRRLDHRDRRRDRRRRALGRADAAWTCSRATRCPMSAPAARSTWSISAPGTRCRSASRRRKLYRHNPTVTLMRTTADECRAIGEFIAAKLNAMRGPVRFLIPEGGRLGDRRARASPSTTRRPTARCSRRSSSASAAGTDRKLLRLPLHINDEAFADALVAAWREVSQAARAGARARLTRREHDHATHRPTDTARTLPRQDRRRPADRSAAAPAPACRPSARKPAAST